MTRHEIETALREAYGARRSNDGRTAAQIFAPDAVYRVAGAKARCPAVTTFQGPQLVPALETMCDTFQATGLEIGSITIDGDRASVMIRGTFVFKPTGATVSSDIGHFWTFRDGKATELVEFLDTAAMSHLAAEATAKAG